MKSVLNLLLLSLAGFTSAARVQRPAVLKVTDSTSNGALSSPAVGKASVYVYRTGRMLGAAGRPIVFVNRDFLVILNRSSYASVDVLPGTVRISATGSLLGLNRNGLSGTPVHFPPAISTSVSGCSGLDWLHLGTQRDAKVTACEDELNDADRTLRRLLAEGEISPTPHERTHFLELCAGVRHYLSTRRGSPIELFSRDGLLACRGEVDFAIDTLTQTGVMNVMSRLEFQAEAGESYYFKWSIPAGFGKGPQLKPVKETTGAKDIKKLHPSDRPSACSMK
ncbi:MAG TPA: hypothetical protein VG206_10730 [Terriglobia bacterium]|nr:hypothetical protein [Terriglobia bacterium]